MRSTDHVIYLTLSPELKSRIRAAALAEHRSVNAQLRHWIERALAEYTNNSEAQEALADANPEECKNE